MVTTEKKEIIPELTQLGPYRYNISLPSGYMEGVKEALLRIEYTGNIGYAFIDGDMVHDNFSNNAVWEIGLSGFSYKLKRIR